MKLDIKNLLVFILAISLFAGCDLSKPPKPAKKPPWGKWLPPDAAHSERRLQVKFGSVLYAIPRSYLTAKGSWDDLTIVNDPKENNGVMIIASYPDLVPVHKMHEHNISPYPSINVILSGHKDDKKAMAIIELFNQKAQNKEVPSFSRFKECGGAVSNSIAKEMNQYNCLPKGSMYFEAVDKNIKTPAGYQLFIFCRENIIDQYKFECFIESRFYDDRPVIARLQTSDLTNLLDMYQKTLQLLSSLEAPNQQGE